MEREARGRRPRVGAVGVGGCARLRSSEACMWSVSSTQLRCAWTLWAVSGNPSGIPGSTMGLATGTSPGLRAGHDVCRAPGSGGTEAGGCAWPLWPAARPLIVSSTRLRLARLRRGHSTRPWHVIDGLRVRAVCQRQCRPERCVVTTVRPSAERLQSIPARPACAGGGHSVTARAITESAACACGVRSIGRVDTTGCASVAGPTTAGAAAGQERMG